MRLIAEVVAAVAALAFAAGYADPALVGGVLAAAGVVASIGATLDALNEGELRANRPQIDPTPRKITRNAPYRQPG